MDENIPFIVLAVNLILTYFLAVHLQRLKDAFIGVRYDHSQELKQLSLEMEKLKHSERRMAELVIEQIMASNTRIIDDE